MTHDPVCGMQIDETKAGVKSEYQGTTYYFCSPSCKAAFGKEPAKYTKRKESSDHHHHHH